ncbi:glutamine synthetase [Labrys wisconsinensis]|uniref:Glutamine synthetase n=1 Tax=Labrys wisconsinensis TaxID=425677 RepID=A0ABU0J043_9HYPH|nr:glutamine synthetase [Labrys wisconsinensis]MDQ0467628.1 glutamine synthetase [Labrys wisconsinensis]
MAAGDEAAARLEAGLRELGAGEVHIGLFDPDAGFRDKLVSADKAVKLARKGYPFCDVLYGWDTAEKTYETGAYVDRPAALHADTLRRYPFAEGAALCIADFTGAFGALSARNQCLRMIEAAAAGGFTVMSAFEFEFAVFAETPETLRAKAFRDLAPFAPANRTYSLQTAALHGPLLAGLHETMRTLGIGVDAIHTELGPGCFEAPLVHAAGIRAADDAALFKAFAKAYFLRQGLVAGFMSKMAPTLSGQSGHLHISFVDREGRPAFHDAAGPHGLSRTALHFIGGLVRLMPEWLALCSQTVNAYKRMVPGAWAPTAANWGVQNRTAAVRVINDTPEATRVEFRVPSADTNPYAALAMALGAGLWGIRNAVEPPAPGAGDFYGASADPAAAFPRDLGAAADRLAASPAARALFGDAFVDAFAAARRFEDAEYRRHVSEWEIRRYLEVV